MRRDKYELTPAPIAVGTATTATTGAFPLATSRLEAGHHRLTATYADDDTYWPARAQVDAAVL